MKITHKKINASTELSINTIPSPYDAYFQIVSDEDVEDITGYPAHPSPCEEVMGYEVNHIAYVEPKPDYYDWFADNGLDIVELVSEGGFAPFLGYVVGDRLYPVSTSDLPDDTTYEEYEEAGYFNDITSSVDTGLNYWYLTKHGLGPGMMPNDCHVMDVIDDGWDTYILLDKMLTTAELKYYDIKEKAPSEELLSAHSVNSSIDIQARFEDDDDDDDYDDEEYDSIPSFDYSDDKVVPAIEKTLNVSTKIAKLIYQWYDNEGAWEDFDSIKDFCSFLKSDIYDMADACDDETERDIVLKAIESCNDITASKVSKVSEDKDTISYVVSSTKDDDFIVDYPIPDDPNSEKRRIARELADEDDYYDLCHGEGIYAAEDATLTDSDMLDGLPEQEYSSADTAINGKQGKLPAVFSKAVIPTGAIVLDYGGGTVESEQVAQNYLDKYNAIEMLYDPYNQTAEHNRQVLTEIGKRGGADVAICSNVLNVIKEQEARMFVLTSIKKLLKPGATAFISVYEGNGLGEGNATQGGKSYQNNAKLVSYLDEVQQVFPNATKKGSVIVAPNTGKSEITFDTDINSVDLSSLEAEIKQGVKDYFASPEGGWPEDELDEAVKSYSAVEIDKQDDKIVIEVRAELSYDGLIQLSEILDSIIAKYDEDAYFEPVTAGILEAYIFDPSYYIDGCTEVKAASDADKIQSLRDAEEDAYLNAEYDEYYKDPHTVTFEFDFDVEVDADGAYRAIGGDAASFKHLDTFDMEDNNISLDAVAEGFYDLLMWNIPDKAGKYNVKGNASLEFYYEYDGYDDFSAFLDAKHSKITDFEFSYLGKVNSSTDIKASMTEEELDTAILEGRPFDLESFKKYKMTYDASVVYGKDIKIGDVINVDEDASEVNLGTVVEVIDINNPAENWIEFTFKCKVVSDPGKQSIEEGDIIELHFDGDEAVGHYAGNLGGELVQDGAETE